LWCHTHAWCCTLQCSKLHFVIDSECDSVILHPSLDITASDSSEPHTIPSPLPSPSLLPSSLLPSLLSFPLTILPTSHFLRCIAGILQHDMWGVEGNARWNWADLRERISKHGLRNSLLIAPMPTASTAQVGRGPHVPHDARSISIRIL
jgi:Ribonucleotide reductase, barrel domain